MSRPFLLGRVLAGAGLVLALAACGGTQAPGTGSGDQVLRLQLDAEPPSLDPALATDTVSFNLDGALFEGLVALGPKLEPTPALAERWDVSKDGLDFTFHLRSTGRWTDGTPVTARDFEYAWKRALAPETASDYAYQLYGIAGAADYNACDPAKTDCRALRGKVAVRALDERTLEVRLTSSQPWFLGQLAQTVFFPVPRQAVERFGESWTEPGHIVTDGPFRLTAWEHEDSLTLERWRGWRGAGRVRLSRIEAHVIPDAQTSLAAFEAGEIDACLGPCFPVSETGRLKGTPDYVSAPALGVSALGLNVKKIDPNLRRALALAIDRRRLVEKVAGAGEPATSFTPRGVPGFDTIRQRFLTERSDLERAKAYLAKSKSRRHRIQLFYDATPGVKELAVTVQGDWHELGIDADVKGMEWGRFLQFLGPPPNPKVDAYRLGWTGDYVDAMSFLDMWTCDSGTNFARFCDPAYDRLAAEARRTRDDTQRFEIYRKLEAMLTGPQGELPVIPLYWLSYQSLRKPNVQGWRPDPLARYDFTRVALAA